MGKPLKSINTTTIEQIKNGTIKSNSIGYEIERLKEHLAGHKLATFRNYPRKEIIDEIIKKYPKRIDIEELEEQTKMKINSFIFRLTELLFCERSKTPANPSTITLILNYMKGIQNDGASDGKPTFIIENRIIPEDKGEIIRAEPKTF